MSISLIATNLSGQVEADFAQLQNEYPEDHEVLLRYTRDIFIEVKEGKPFIEIRNNYQVAMLRTKDQVYKEEMIPYEDQFYTLKDLSASTWVSEKGKFRKIPVKEFEDVQELDDESFYDGKRYKKFAYPAVKEGVVTESKYTYEIHDGVSMGKMRFRFPIPVVYARLTVTCTPDVELGYLTHGDFTSIKHSTGTEGKNRTYTWEALASPKNIPVNFTVSDDPLTPRLFVFVKSFINEKKRIPYMGSMDDLYKYNYEFIRETIREDASPQIVNVVDSLKTVSNSPESLAANIYRWVQDHIRYIAIEDGMGAFIPRNSSDVVRKHYGDCKDMANLLRAMLTKAGLNGYVAWVGTRDIPYSISEFPLLSSINHMIAVYKHENGEYLFLDATDPNEKFGTPTQSIQLKDVIVSISEDQYVHLVIPEIPAEMNYADDSVFVRIDGMNIVLNGTTNLGGYIRNSVVSRLEYANPKDMEEEMFKILKRGNDKCILNSYDAEGLENRNDPLKINYSLTIQDYVRKIGNEMFINLGINKGITKLRPDTLGRECDVEFEFQFTDQSYYELTCPEGYTITNIPENLSISNKHLDAQYIYEIRGNRIICSSSVKIRSMVIPYSDIKAWMDNVNLISQHLKKVVTLTKI